MNRYPAWLNALVVSVVLLGVLLALPNIYPSVPAVQMSSAEGKDYEPGIVDAIVRVLAERQALFRRESRQNLR